MCDNATRTALKVSANVFFTNISTPNSGYKPSSNDWRLFKLE